MIKKTVTTSAYCIRKISPEKDDEPPSENEANLPFVNFRYNYITKLSFPGQFSTLADLIELRKLRNTRQEIDVVKSNEENIKKKKKQPRERERTAD
jgi:hypothetical protein